MKAESKQESENESIETLFDAFNGEASDILYHYCSAEAFETILRTGRIRFSDINMLNDAAEMNWGYSMFLEAASHLLVSKDDRDRKYISEAFMTKVDLGINDFRSNCPMLTASFSLNSDDLGQWRSYAANGSGFAIGFNPASLDKMPCTMLRCIYDEEKQKRLLSSHLRAMAVLENERKEEYGSDFFNDCYILGGFMPAFKNPTFASEEEVRGVRMLIASDHASGGILIEDPGGNSTDDKDKEIEVEPQPVAFRVRGEEIIIHQDIDYLRSETTSDISKITVGPTNSNQPGIISALVNHHGHDGAEIEISRSTYQG